MNESGYSGTQAAKIVGITYRQLDYWARTELVEPSVTEASASGSRRQYSYRDLLELRVIKTMLDASAINVRKGTIATERKRRKTNDL